MPFTPPPLLTASPVSPPPSNHPEIPPSRPGSGSTDKLTPDVKSIGNVFSNDGSFLEKFQRLQKDDDGKKKREALARKRTLDNRFKSRGKRPSPNESDSTHSPAVDSARPPIKKPKKDHTMTDYQKQVKAFAGRSLKDDGMGVRPLVK
ncbi:hypothetical protein OF83DRAFT_1138087 [Amylostereum chailletii]|nr:hypothetical protein OF83DRAFT_1138087 [Amylostereum chailletii]